MIISFDCDFSRVDKRSVGASAIRDWFESSPLTLADKQGQKGRNDLSGNAD